MEIKKGRLSSEAVRRQWRDVVDHVVGGHHVVVTRTGKPLIALIPFEDFLALKDELEDLYENRRLAQLIADYRRNPTGDPVMDRFLAHQEAARDAAPSEAALAEPVHEQ